MVRNGAKFFELANPLFFQQRYGAASHSQKQSRLFRTEQSSVYCNFFFLFSFSPKKWSCFPGPEIDFFQTDQSSI